MQMSIYSIYIFNDSALRPKFCIPLHSKVKLALVCKKCELTANKYFQLIETNFIRFVITSDFFMCVELAKNAVSPVFVVLQPNLQDMLAIAQITCTLHFVFFICFTLTPGLFPSWNNRNNLC